MSNPWLNIPFNDYEGHMSSIGQLQILNRTFRDVLRIYAPKSITVLGSATGNGFEHIDTSVTKRIRAIDINKEFLEVSLKRHCHRLSGLVTHNLNLRENEIEINPVDLVFAGLIFEYIDPKILSPKIRKITKSSGIVVVVIQSTSSETDFVSNTKYNSLSELAKISVEVSDTNLYRQFSKEGFKQVNKKTTDLRNGKKFIEFILKKEG